MLAYTIHGKILKTHIRNNKFKISALAWNEEPKSPDGSYSVSDIRDYFEYILKKIMVKKLLIPQY